MVSTFKTWLENKLFDAIKDELHGEPYMEVKIKEIAKNKREIDIKYIWKGYQVPTHAQHYSAPGEFGGFDAVEEDDGWWDVGGVGLEEPFRRKGFATKMYRRAVEEIKKIGGKGLRSHKTAARMYRKKNTIPAATQLWNSFQDKTSDDEHDYLQ